MRKIMLCLLAVAAGGLFGQSTLTRGAAGPFTWDVNNTSFTTDSSGVKWVNGSIALFNYYGGGSGYPVRVSSSPNGRVEMNALTFGSTGNWLFYGDDILIGAGGISSISSATDTMNISNNVVLGASQVWKRLYNARDMRVYGNVSSAPDTVTDLTLDSQNEGGYFTLHGSNSYTGSLTIQGLAGVDLDYIRGPFSKFDATRPITVNNGTRLYLRNGGGYTQEVSQLVLNGAFGFNPVLANTASPVRMKINSLVRNSPYATLSMDLDKQLILPGEPQGFIGPHVSGTTGWGFVNADGSVDGGYSGDTIDDPAQWTTADRAVNVNAVTPAVPAGMYMTNGVMRFGQTTMLNLNGGVLTLTKGGLTRCNQHTAISNGIIRSSAPNGALFVQTSRPWGGAPDFTIAAQIADDGTNAVTLVKGGADKHTLFLSGRNTYTGGTRVNEGFITVVGGGNIGGGDLYLLPYDSILGGTLHRLQFLNTVSASNRVRNVFAPASGIMKGGSASAEVSLVVDGFATNLMVEANLGRLNYVLNGPALVKTVQSGNNSILNFTANHPQVTAGTFYLNNLNSEIQFNSSIAEPINCNGQFYSDTASGIFRFRSGTWRMKNVWINSKTWKGTNIIEGSSSLVFWDNLDNCSGDILIRENGGLALARNSINFATAYATSNRNYVVDIRDNGYLTVSNGAFNVGGFVGAGATVNQVSGTVRVMGNGGDLSLKSLPSLPAATYNLSGGKLFVQNQLKGSAGTAASRFNWTGGEFAFWAVYTSMLENGKLVNNGGTLAPGGVGLAAMSSIDGIYEVASNSAVLAIDLGGTTASGSRAGQDPAAGYFDFVIGAANAKIRLGGRLEVTLRGGFKPLALQTFTILAINSGAANELSGTFANLSNGKVVTTDGQYVFDVTIDSAAYTVKLSNAKRNAWTGAAGDGNWANAANWSGGVAPSGASVVALLDPVATDNQIALGQALALGSLVLDSKTGHYTLSGTDGLSLGGLTVSSGRHTLDVPVTLTGDTVVQVDTVCSNAGLYFGRLDGNASTAPNPQTSIETTLTWAYTTVDTANLTNSPWLAQASQLIYSGYIWNNDPTNVTWSFAAMYDDLARLKINDVQLYDVGWATFAKTNAVLNPGANSFELRLGNYSSNAGPLNGFGPVYDPQGRLSDAASNYVQFAEAGQGLLFTTTSTRTMLEGQVLFAKTVTASNVIKNGVGVVSFAVGADLQQLTLNAGRVSFAGELTIHNGVVRTAGTLDFAASTAALRLQKVTGVTLAAVQSWITDGWFSIQGKTVVDERFYSVKDMGDGYITVRIQKVGTRIILL